MDTNQTWEGALFRCLLLGASAIVLFCLSGLALAQSTCQLNGIAGGSAQDEKALACGPNSFAGSVESAAFGHTSEASNFFSTALGNSSKASGSGSVATGVLSRATNDATVAIGGAFDHDGSGSINEPTLASGRLATALGSHAQATANSSVALGATSIADRPSTVSVGKPGAARQIVNVAAGTQAMDAVNLRQLTSAIQQLETRVDARMREADALVAELKFLRAQLRSTSARDLPKPSASR